MSTLQNKRINVPTEAQANDIVVTYQNLFNLCMYNLIIVCVRLAYQIICYILLLDTNTFSNKYSYFNYPSIHRVY
jgi:hypothetical protein